MGFRLSNRHWGVLLLVLIIVGSLAKSEGCEFDSEATDSCGASRDLNVFDFPLHRKLSKAIINGDIDRAAELVANAVSLGDGNSIVRGFSSARAQPGNDFSVIQTVVRALNMGVDRQKLETTVETGGQGNDGDQEVVQEIRVVLDGAVGDGQAAPAPAPPQTVQYVQGSHQQYLSLAGQIPTTTTNVNTPLGTSPSLLVNMDGSSDGLNETTVDASAGFVPAGQPAVTVMVDPMVTQGGSIFEQEAVRECRGGKEEQCCREFSAEKPGCTCDFTG
ncbi:hypothetical protein BSKO_02988 [Bryopsis sp. KO-2023]|nr:hypothetical protein BSKO_02988 [Bryopsis sp. KO-2023]